jgi:hypothetical protein
MSDFSFSLLATKTATTKRTPAMVGNKRGAPAANLADVKCTPPDPVDAETMRRLNLNTPAQLKQCFVDATYDIIEGDEITIDAIAYPIRKVEPYDWLGIGGGTYRVLYLETLKG